MVYGHDASVGVLCEDIGAGRVLDNTDAVDILFQRKAHPNGIIRNGLDRLRRCSVVANLT